jgi:hypothetical protein
LTVTALTDCLARHPALSHVVIALLLQVIVATTLRIARAPSPWWFGATVAITFYFSRKKLEIEHLADPSGAHKAATWTMGWFPPLWPWPYQIQFYAPALAVVCVALFASRAGVGGRMALVSRKRSPRGLK